MELFSCFENAGYEKRNIKIDINEDGNLIAISGKKQVQETVMVGWRVYKNDKETKRFKKVFRIPEGVILDKIKAKFDEDESTLTISMPKKVKGIQGKALEEVKETVELARGGSANLQINADEQIQKSEGLREGDDENTEARRDEDKVDSITQDMHSLEQKKPISEDQNEPDTRREGKRPQNEQQKVIGGVKSSQENLVHPAENEMPKDKTGKQISATNTTQERAEIRPDDQQEKQVNNDQVTGSDSNEEVSDEAKGDDPEKRLEKRFKICTPIVASSAILLSLVVFVYQVIRSKNQSNRRKD